MATTEKATAEVTLNGAKAATTLKELANLSKQLDAELRKVDTTTKEFAAKEKELQKVNQKLYDLKQNTRALTDEMKKSQGGIEGMFGKMKDYAMELGGAMVALFSVNAIKDYFKEGITKAIELRDTEKILLNVLEGNATAQRELIGLAKERAGTTTSGRLEIEQAEKFLVIQGRTPEQIRKTITAAQDLATVTGQGLKSAVEELDGTMEGRLGKGLQKLSSQFKDLSKDQLYNGAAIDIIGAKYKGLAEDEAKTVGGQEIMMEKSWGALQRTLGNYVLGSGTFYSSTLSGFKNLFDSIGKRIAQTNEENKSAVQKFQELGGSVANLVTNIQPLADRYDVLQAKTTLSKDEQTELKKIIGDVTAAMPGAATAFDKYGDAISISSDRVRDYIKNQMILLRYANKQAIEETAKELQVQVTKIAAVKGDMDKIAQTGTFDVMENKPAQGHSFDLSNYSRKATQEEIAAQVAANQEFVNNKIALETKLKVLTGDALQQSLDSYQKDKDLTAKKLEDGKKASSDLLNLKKLSMAELDNLISRGREADATNTDRTNMRQAMEEQARRGKHDDTIIKKTTEAYKNLIDQLKVIEGKNYADKFTATQQEIRGVEDKYNTLIDRAKKFKEENDKILTPAQKTEIDSNASQLAVQRDAQVKQVMVQAEKAFSDDILQIHEKLRVARIAVTQRQVYEVNKKYDDARKEILGAVFFAYNEEVKAAEGNNEKLILAEKHKKEAIAAIDKDLKYLTKAQKEEVADTRQKGSEKFDEELNTLKEKGDRDVALNKEKIQIEVNLKYKKLLESSLEDDQEIARIKVQMAAETDAKILKATRENTKKVAQEAIAVAQTAVNALGSIFQMEDKAQADKFKKEEDISNQKKASLDAQLKAKLITQKQHDTQVAALDADMAKKKKKLDHDAAVHAKEMALFNALISVAVAVAGALANPPGPGGIVMSIIAAALGAIQVGFILGEKIPEAATGRYNVIGQQDNKAYSNVPYQESFTGIPGHPMLVNETGNEIVIDPKTTRNLMVNYPGVISAINFARVPQRASGSYLPDGITPTLNQAANAASSLALTKALNRFNENSEKGTRSFIVYDDIRDTASKINEIENSVKSN